MPRGGFSGSLISPKVDVFIDMGNPFLNRTVDGFLKIGAVGACKVAAEETFKCLSRVSVPWMGLRPVVVLGGSCTSLGHVFIDMGNPFLNRTVDGSLKIGAVGACKVAAEETFKCLNRGNVSKHKIEHALKKMCKEGAYWGSVAGIYVGMEYGVERIRGRNDWKNAMIGGALSGALISAASNSHKDKVIKDAITAGAVATAVEFINYLT